MKLTTQYINIKYMVYIIIVYYVSRQSDIYVNGPHINILLVTYFDVNTEIKTKSNRFHKAQQINYMVILADIINDI